MSDQAPEGHRLPTRFQAPGPRAGRLSRAGRRTVVVVVVAAFALSIIAASAGRPPARIPASGAERFVAPDGHRTILVGTDPAAGGTTQVRQTGHQPGNHAWIDGPWWFFTGMTDIDFANKQYWVIETEDDAAGDTPQLLRLDDSGLTTQVQGWPEIRSFDPARPEVPANPQPGQRIATTGQTETPPGPNRETTSYTSILEVHDAAPVGPECLEFRRTDTTGTAAPVTTSRVRCPDRGVVRLDLPGGRWDAAADWPDWDDPRSSVNIAEPPPGPVRNLVPHRIEFRRGQLPAQVSAGGPLFTTGQNYAFAASTTGNLLWLTPGSDRFELTAWVDAGGNFVGTAECGDVIVAATSQRAVIAHDDVGRWLWTTELADVAGTDPVRAGDDLLVATKDGRLSALDCRRGTVRWTADDIGSTVTPAVGPAGILVAGEGGVRLLDPGTGRDRWERALPGKPRSVAFLGMLAVAVDSEELIHALTTADGLPVWTERAPDTVAEMHALDGMLALRTGSGFVGVDMQGRRRWQHEFDAIDSVSDGRDIFAVDPGGGIVIDADGRTVEQTSAPMNIAASTIFLVRTPTGVTAADGVGTLIDWRRT